MSGPQPEDDWNDRAVVTPRTEAGRALFRAVGDKLPSNRALVDYILAIEAEAAARQVERIAALEGYLTDHVEGRCIAGRIASTARIEEARALLGAGDKAEAPRYTLATWTCRRCHEDDHDQCKEWPGGERCLCSANGHWTPPLLRLDREDEAKPEPRARTEP